MHIVLGLVMFIVAVAGVAAFVRHELSARRAFVGTFDEDPDLQAVEGRPTANLLARVMTRPGATHRHDVVSARLASISARSTLVIRREDALGRVRALLGGHDIHTGDPRIDQLLHIEGSDDGFIRALLATSPVRAAAVALFDGKGGGDATSLAIDVDGSVVIRAARHGMRADDARRIMDHVLAMLHALDDAAPKVAASLPAPRIDEVVGGAGGGGGSASGAPLGVPALCAALAGSGAAGGER